MWRNIPKLLHEKTKLNILVYSRFGYGKSSNAKLPRPTNYMSIEAEKYLTLFFHEVILVYFATWL
jgi:hypothetical protein